MVRLMCRRLCCNTRHADEHTMQTPRCMEPSLQAALHAMTPRSVAEAGAARTWERHGHHRGHHRIRHDFHPCRRQLRIRHDPQTLVAERQRGCVSGTAYSAQKHHAGRRPGCNGTMLHAQPSQNPPPRPTGAPRPPPKPRPAAAASVSASYPANTSRRKRSQPAKQPRPPALLTTTTATTTTATALKAHCCCLGLLVLRLRRTQEQRQRFLRRPTNH